MGVLDSLTKAFSQTLPEQGTHSGGITNIESLMGTKHRGSNVSVGQNILLENIYDVTAKEIAQLKFNHVIHKDDKVEEKESDLSYCLNYEASDLFSATDFWYSVGYQVSKYGNAIILPEYIVKNGEVDISSLDLLDVNKYVFGRGYARKGKEKELYLLLVEKKDWNEFRLAQQSGAYDNKSSDLKIKAYKYSEIFHIRDKPIMAFDNDNYKNTSINELTEIYDKNLNSMLDELSQNNTISAVLKVKGALSGVQGKTSKREELVRSLQTKDNYGLIVLDDGEEFTPLVRKYNTVSMEDLDKVMTQLNRYYGINESILNGTYTFEEYSTFYNKTLEPIVIKIIQEINRKALGRKRIRDGEKIVSMRRNLLNGGALKDITEAADKYVYHGILTTNEIRAEFGLAPTSGGDTVYTNANAVVVGSQNNQDPVPSPDDGKQLTLEFESYEDKKRFEHKLEVENSSKGGKNIDGVKNRENA